MRGAKQAGKEGLDDGLAAMDTAVIYERSPQAFRKLARMEHRLDRAVEKGRLTQAQADQFKAEARQLQEEVRAQLQATNCQLSDAQREQFKARKDALREKVKGALKDYKPQQDV